MVASFAITIFLGSFLLFQVQPMLGKQLIPLFGGSPAVWTTCMLFFQTVLIAGYAYAHGLTYLEKRKQAYVHFCLLVGGLLFLHLDLGNSEPVVGLGSPIPTILWLLTTSVGFPFLLLSASAPLLQHWFITGHRGKSPWKLYALSNTGSLLALLSYPVFFEPLMGIDNQARIWRWGYTIYIALCCVCLLKPLLQGENSTASHIDGAAEQSEEGRHTSISIPDTILWFVCSACGSATLLAVTNQICQQVAVVPFLFVLTLAVYLVTFIACFGAKRASSQRLGAVFLIVTFVFTIFVLTAGNGFSLPVQLSVLIGVLISSCMICHGQLVRLRPKPSALTFYYLVIALGGAGGSVFISLLAPQLFNSYVELPFLVIIISFLFTVGAWRARAGAETPRWFLWLGGAILGCQIFFSLFYVKVLNYGVVESSRNFYGTLKVIEETDTLGRILTLKHGVIIHGRQYQDGSLRNIATTYYGPDTGVGLALRFHPRRFAATGDGEKQLRVGLVGLGVGTLASYGETGDTFRFYEIDPTEIHLAQKYFSYLRDSKARIEIVTGDARLSLQQEARQGGKDKFDILVIDAFSNDAIPVHLITREAVGLYLSLLQADGILLFHISSRALDLMPVLATHATAFGVTAVKAVTPDEPNMGRYVSHWAILTKNRSFLDNEQVRSRVSDYSHRKIDWTDKFASIWQVLN